MAAKRLQTFHAYSSEFIGIPYQQLDCWKLAVKFYRVVMGVSLKHYYTDTPVNRSDIKGLIYSNKGEFIKVNDLEFGDLVLISILGIESHIAIYIGEGLILHTTKNINSCIEKLSKYETRVTGFYRHMEAA